MRAYCSAHTLCNPVLWPITCRFADRLSDVGDSLTNSSVRRQHYSGSPIYQDKGCNLCLSSPLSACNDHLGPATLKRKLRWHRHLRTTTATAA